MGRQHLGITVFKLISLFETRPGNAWNYMEAIVLCCPLVLALVPLLKFPVDLIIF